VVTSLCGLVLLTENNDIDIKREAKVFYDEINNARIAKALPSFEEIDEPKIARIDYAYTLSLLYDEYAKF
jgi:hypothetical protein